MQSRICNVINAGTLFGLGTVFLSFYGTGRIEQYLNPSFRPLVMVGGILMLIMGVGLFRSFHEMYGLDYLALRPFNVYGPRMDAVGAYTEVMIRWMDRLANGQPCVILGDGEQTMDFVFVEDVARAYILAAKAPLTDEVFNIASGTETSLNELAGTLGRVMGVSGAPEYGPPRKVNHVSRRLADVSKAERLLGFKAQISLEEGLRRLVDWWTRKEAPELAACSF